MKWRGSKLWIRKEKTLRWVESFFPRRVLAWMIQREMIAWSGKPADPDELSEYVENAKTIRQWGKDESNG